MKIFYSVIAFLLFSTIANGQSFFKLIDESSIHNQFSKQRSIVPNKYKVAQLDIRNIKRYLSAPSNSDKGLKNIVLLNPEGQFEEFTIKEVEMMEAGIAARYPGIKTFKGYNTQNKSIKVHLGISSTGFYASIAAPQSSYSIDRYADKEDRFYISYYNRDFIEDNAVSYTCGALAKELEEQDLTVSTRSAGELLPLRTYRFALACTGEFGSFYGPSKEDVLAEMMKSVNRMNMVLENDFAVRLIIIDDNDKLIWTDANTDPYPDGNTGGTLLDENTRVITENIGFGNFDLGHVYTRGCDDTGGIAILESVCTGYKGGGVTCHYSNDITTMAIRVAAHEVGHQLGSSHTFNNCDGNEESKTAYEPGSGSTIMSYGGLCGSELNVVNIADDYYHVSSLIQVTNFTRNLIGNNCATLVETDNHIPEVSIPIAGGFTIPVSTPFELTGVAIDEDGDDMTYNWEQFNLGPKVIPGAPTANSPSFISTYPSESPTRVFPKLSSVVNNVSDKTEVLPTYDRELNFQFIARDNNIESGGVAWEEIEFYASSSAGPFLLEYPSTADTFVVGQEIEIVWDVAHTDNEIINCQSVDILLSLDGGFNYTDTLLSNTVNDGFEKIFIPNLLSNQARIKIKAADNIFFDISNENINIIEPEEPSFIFSFSPSYVSNCVPNEIQIDLKSEALLGFDEPIKFQVGNEIPSGIHISFEKELINPGESNIATISFSDPSLSGDASIEIEAITENDTVRRNVVLNLISSDFSDISAVYPAVGSSGNEVSPVFTWTSDSDAHEYLFKLADNPSFDDELSSFTMETTLTDTVFQLEDILDKNTVYYWTVLGVNECGLPTESDIYAFATETLSCSVYNYNDVPLGISQSGVLTIEMPIDVIAEGQVTDVNIRKIRGTHTWVSELKGEIQSPSGLSVLLFNKKCGNQSDFNAGFDDDAAIEINCPLNRGIFYKPEEKLDTFNGEDINGIWIFKLSDTQVGNGGSIQEYVLELCSNEVLESPYLVNNIEMPLPNGLGRRITNEFLLAEDNNNIHEELIYTIVKLPTNGELKIDDKILEVGSNFTQLDIDNKHLRYQHDGGSENDNFQFVVEDGEGGWVELTSFEIIIDNNTVLGVSDFELINFNIFPNPNSGKFNIIFDEFHKDLSIDILDVSGRKIANTFYSSSDQVSVNVDGIERGIYFVLVTGEDFRGVRKIVVERE